MDSISIFFTERAEARSLNQDAMSTFPSLCLNLFCRNLESSAPESSRYADLTVHPFPSPRPAMDRPLPSLPVAPTNAPHADNRSPSAFATWKLRLVDSDAQSKQP